jgi:predicted nuclease of predicted toxin-antitoxin system
VRFILDHDVDVSLRAFLIAKRHECWSAGEARMARRSDEDLAIYAHRIRAVIISHDIEFAGWRKKRTYGQHIWLRCPEPAAVETLSRYRDEIVPCLAGPAVFRGTVPGGARA